MQINRSLRSLGIAEPGSGIATARSVPTAAIATQTEASRDFENDCECSFMDASSAQGCLPDPNIDTDATASQLALPVLITGDAADDDIDYGDQSAADPSAASSGERPPNALR